jgi:hypothetical protein
MEDGDAIDAFLEQASTALNLSYFLIDRIIVMPDRWRVGIKTSFFPFVLEILVNQACIDQNTSALRYIVAHFQIAIFLALGHLSSCTHRQSETDGIRIRRSADLDHDMNKSIHRQDIMEHACMRCASISSPSFIPSWWKVYIRSR